MVWIQRDTSHAHTDGGDLQPQAGGAGGAEGSASEVGGAERGRGSRSEVKRGQSPARAFPPPGGRDETPRLAPEPSQLQCSEFPRRATAQMSIH